MKERTVCFTGHREIPKWAMDSIRQNLMKTIKDLIQQGYCYFGAGGALGFDTLAAQTIIKLRQSYPWLKLILVLPCLSQANGWSKKDREIYEKIKDEADKVVYTSQEYYRGCMHKRNRHLVDNSSACVCYLTKTSGGTFYTVGYAKMRGLSIYNIAEIQRKDIST